MHCFASSKEDDYLFTIRVGARKASGSIEERDRVAL